MKDLIAERDKKEKMKHSIVKWWNVHYMTPEELEEEQAKEAMPAPAKQAAQSDCIQADEEQAPQGSMPQKSDAAQEIIDRLNREAAEDEARKQREIERVEQEVEANFNEATGSYSGAYGLEGADGSHKDQIDAILAEKDDALRHLIERTEEQ